jgi:hypothetical protein
VCLFSKERTLLLLSKTWQHIKVKIMPNKVTDPKFCGSTNLSIDYPWLLKSFSRAQGAKARNTICHVHLVYNMGKELVAAPTTVVSTQNVRQMMDPALPRPFINHINLYTYNCTSKASNGDNGEARWWSSQFLICSILISLILSAFFQPRCLMINSSSVLDM